MDNEAEENELVILSAKIVYSGLCFHSSVYVCSIMHTVKRDECLFMKCPMEMRVSFFSW